MIKDEINSCTASYIAYQNDTIPPLLSRVIGDESEPPRLLHLASINNRAPYAALSYTWGVHLFQSIPNKMPQNREVLASVF